MCLVTTPNPDLRYVVCIRRLSGSDVSTELLGQYPPGFLDTAFRAADLLEQRPSGLSGVSDKRQLPRRWQSVHALVKADQLVTKGDEELHIEYVDAITLGAPYERTPRELRLKRCLGALTSCVEARCSQPVQPLAPMDRIPLRIPAEGNSGDCFSKLAAGKRVSVLGVLTTEPLGGVAVAGRLTGHCGQGLQCEAALAFRGDDGVELALKCVALLHEFVHSFACGLELSK
jgi:hypothetical protein